jgi:hypothetical protein
MMPGHPKQKCLRELSGKKLGPWHMLVLISVAVSNLNSRVLVQVSLGKKQDLISKIMRARRAGGTAQVVECLHSKYKALCSNPSLPAESK